MILRQSHQRFISVAPLVLFALSITATAAAQTTKVAARYSATTTSLSAGAGIDISVDVMRWSTDEEAGKLIAAFKGSNEHSATALEQSASVGYVWTSTSAVGYSVKMARQISLPDGGSRVVLVVVPTLGSWDRPAWKSTTQSTDYPFTVIEMRVTKAGRGEGKASLAGKVAVDEAAKAIVLENYATAPVLLKGVTQRDAATGAAPSVPKS